MFIIFISSFSLLFLGCEFDKQKLTRKLTESIRSYHANETKHGVAVTSKTGGGKAPIKAKVLKDDDANRYLTTICEYIKVEEGTHTLYLCEEMFRARPTPKEILEAIHVNRYVNPDEVNTTTRKSLPKQYQPLNVETAPASTMLLANMVLPSG